jgi:hypothetical protein
MVASPQRYDTTLICEIESRMSSMGNPVGRHMSEDDVPAGRLAGWSIAAATSYGRPSTVLGVCLKQFDSAL